MEGSLQFLGTGSSLGVPVVGCKCAVCLDKEEKNKRMRSSALLRVKDKAILIDAGPDHRAQALQHKIDHLDGAIITHDHYDHIGGMDDLKVYSYQKDKLPCLLSSTALNGLRERFFYLFPSKGKEESPFFSCQVVESPFESVEFLGLPIKCVSFLQNKTKVMGIRIGGLAYISDIKTYEEELITHLEGVDVLVVSAARAEPTPMHFSFEDAIAFAKKVQAKTTYLTHLDHSVGHVVLQNLLPQSIFVAYDGLTILF